MTELSLGELVERQLAVASLSGEVQGVMEGIVARLLELSHADGASLSTVNDGIAHFTVSRGADQPLQGQTFAVEDTLAAACVQTGELQVLRGASGSDMSGSLTEEAGAIVLAPLVYDGATRGVLGVRSRRLDAFGENEVEAMRLLAQSAAIALRNAELIENLAASERQYRDLHAHAADATLVYDLDGNLLDANEAAAALLWYRADELRGMRMAALVDPAELAAEPAHIAELLEHRELRAERIFLRKDGTPISIEYASRLLDDGRVHTTLRDITQRKRNEERLRTSLDQLHAIVQTQQDISALELDPLTVTRTIVERAQLLTGGDGAAVEWHDGQDSVIRVACGLAEAHVGLRVSRATSLAGLAATRGEPIYAADTATDSRVDAAACLALGARSLICAPLYRNGTVEGVLTIVGAKPEAFDELAVETTRLMAEFVSTVMRNSAELETRRTLVEELRTQAQVVQHMQTALWVWALEADGEFRLDYANAASEAATGLTAETTLGRTLREVLPALPEEMVESFRSVVENNTLYDGGEIEYGDDRIASGIFSFKAFPLAGRRVALTFENVTEGARARRALQESEARFRGAFHAASVGMALTGFDGSFAQVNSRFAEMLGYSVDELTALGVGGITHPDDFAADVSYGAQLRSGEIDSYHREKRYLRKDGSVMWADLTVSLVRTSDDEEPMNIVSHVQDITDRKESELLFSAIFEDSVVPKLIADDERRIVDLNGAAAELLGVAREQALGLNLDALLPDEPIARLWPRFLEDGTMDAEVTLVRPDGAQRQIEFLATANVRPGRHISVVRDLSHQKALEDQLRQAQKMEAVGRLAGGIAHDFNNLLTAISGYSEFLIDGLHDERQLRHAHEIRKAAARAASLTGQLLAFSRRQVLQPRVLDLNAIVSDMDMMLRRLIGEDVELVTLLAPDLGAVLADPTQIEQVIVNLAVNARDAMPLGGSVTIRTTNVETEHGPVVELSLTDTGVGMTESEREQLFDPFFTTKAGGTGLGLATVYGVVEQSGGTIEVESSPGMGSSFHICLPRAGVAAEPPQSPRVVTDPARGDETILLVEDETVVRQLVAEILENAGYAVLPAADGPSALELIRRNSKPIDLLLTDVVMPGMSGPEVAAAVTSMRPGTEVLYMSGYTDSAIGHHGVLEPGIAFLQKPFSADELTRKVRSLLTEPAAAPA
jgi:two-component system cell cycle sensor histidine kinase/response regulator CckA